MIQFGSYPFNWHNSMVLTRVFDGSFSNVIDLGSILQFFQILQYFFCTLGSGIRSRIPEEIVTNENEFFVSRMGMTAESNRMSNEGASRFFAQHFISFEEVESIEVNILHRSRLLPVHPYRLARIACRPASCKK